MELIFSNKIFNLIEQHSSLNYQKSHCFFQHSLNLIIFSGAPELIKFDFYFL